MQHFGPADPALPMERSQQVDMASQQTLQDARSCWARTLDRTLDILLAVALLVELTIVFCSIISRSVFSAPWHWTNEAAEMSLTTIAFLGGAYAYRRGEHAFIRTLVEALPQEARRACAALVEYFVLTVAIMTGVSACTFFAARWDDLTPVLYMHTSWFVLPLILSMVVLALTAMERLFAQHRPTVLAIGTGFVTLVLLLVLTREAWRPWTAGNAILALTLGLFFAVVLIGLPVGFALLLSALAFLFASGRLPLIMLAQTTVRGVNNYVLLAVPFFILAGMVMNEGGISRRLVRMVHAFVGHLRGGLFQVMVVSMYIVSGLSGSKAADVAAVGLVMRNMLREEGYNMERATAVLAAATVMGETVPPSIPMLVLGSITTLSIGTLFIAGLLPAAVVGVCLMLLIYVQFCRTSAPPAGRASLGQMWKASVGGILPLCMPVILFGGILAGVATATEVSSFAVVYGIILAGFVYRELGLRRFLRGTIDCAVVTGMILFILGGASSFAWTLTMAQLPHRLVALLGAVHQSQWVFLMASILLLIVTGAILEGLPALLILAPILLPVAAQVGVSQLHYGIVLLIAMGIGAFAPPVGVGFYFACAVLETRIEASSREMIPYICVLFLGLVLVAMVPWFTLSLPALFHLAG